LKETQRRCCGFLICGRNEEFTKELRSLVERSSTKLESPKAEMLLSGANDQLNAICTFILEPGGTRISGLGRDAFTHVPEWRAA